MGFITLSVNKHQLKAMSLIADFEMRNSVRHTCLLGLRNQATATVDIYRSSSTDEVAQKTQDFVLENTNSMAIKVTETVRKFVTFFVAVNDTMYRLGDQETTLLPIPDDEAQLIKRAAQSMVTNHELLLVNQLMEEIKQEYMYDAIAGATSIEQTVEAYAKIAENVLGAIKAAAPGQSMLESYKNAKTGQSSLVN